MKVVINSCYGGFFLSEQAILLYSELSGNSEWSGDRSDPVLVQVVEQLGDKSGSFYSDLKIVEIPDDVKWKIQDYDGNEWVTEVHRTWS